MDSSTINIEGALPHTHTHTHTHTHCTQGICDLLDPSCGELKIREDHKV